VPGNGMAGFVTYPYEFEKNGKVYTLPKKVGVYTLIFDREKFLLVDALWKPEEKFLKEFAEKIEGRKYENAAEPLLEHIFSQIKKYHHKEE
jgi:hypothetical protein